jgi:hypothetical protein
VEQAVLVYSYGWKSPDMGRDLDCMADVLMGMMAVTIRTSAPCDFCDFQPYQEVKTACSTIILKLAVYGLQHVFEKWVERCKKCIAFQGRYFEKETVTAPPQSSDSE